MRASHPESSARAVPGLLLTPRFHRHVPPLSIHLPDEAEAALRRGSVDALVLDRARRLVRRIVETRIGGACWGEPPDPTAARARLLVLPHDAAAAERALTALLDKAEPQAATLVLPEFPNRALTALARQASGRGCAVLRDPVDPWPLLDTARSVDVPGDHPVALLALMLGRPIRYVTPFPAAGPGATDEAIVAATLLFGTRYADPFTGARIDAEAAVEQAAEWRRLCDANRGIAGLAGMSVWKRRRMRQFFHTGTRSPPFVTRATKGGAVAAWSSRIPPGLADAEIVRVEDGFVRSVGLGSDFLPPCSIVADASGIYYDPSRPSDLETILATTPFPPALLDRARRLVDRLVAGGITKYGRSGAGAAALAAPPGRKRVLVPGQVANDLSVRLGGAGIADNLTLLARVRAAEPDAFIVYKPHPDVDAGHRPGALPDEVVLRHADQVARGVPMPALLAAVDELHTLTSLAGFEALLRGRVVAVYGQPFYAGWGLTRDVAPIARRTRRLSLEQLAAGTLLLYPRYLDPVTGLPCPAETLLDRLAEPELWRSSPLSVARRLQGRLRRLLGTRAPGQAKAEREGGPG